MVCIPACRWREQQKAVLGRVFSGFSVHFQAVTQGHQDLGTTRTRNSRSETETEVGPKASWIPGGGGREAVVIVFWTLWLDPRGGWGLDSDPSLFPDAVLDHQKWPQVSTQGFADNSEVAAMKSQQNFQRLHQPHSSSGTCWVPASSDTCMTFPLLFQHRVLDLYLRSSSYNCFKTVVEVGERPRRQRRQTLTTPPFRNTPKSQLLNNHFPD